MMIQPGRPARFSFVDEGEAVRRLDTDRETLLALVRDKRLRAYPGVGKGNFFRTSDLDALYPELHPEAQQPAEAPAAGQPGQLLNPTLARKQHDPAYKVHLRLQADLKWFDITDDDLRAFVREMHPAAFEKNRSNITGVIARLTTLVEMMDEAAARWNSQGEGNTTVG